MYKKRSTSKLAKIIATELLNGIGKPRNITCMCTGETVAGHTDYNLAVTINPTAIGAHYLAYGYYYLLCYDKGTEEEYVAVHTENNNKLIGTIENPEYMEVLTRGAETTN